MKSQVTTKTGDEGTTRILGGEHLPKSHPIVEATGSLDALRARLARLRLVILERNPGQANKHAEFLWWVLHVNFVTGAQISDPLWKNHAVHPGKVGPEHLKRLEEEQARIEAMTTLPHAFIVSASTLTAAEADIAATVVRDFERRLVALHEALPEFECAHLLAFYNRLSDYLFILARHLDNGRYQTVDYTTAIP